MEKNKRLYRSAKSKVIGGVAGGIAEYFEIDPIIIRLLFVIIALAGGGGAIVYLILWIALPLEPITMYNMNIGTGAAPDADNAEGQPASEFNAGASDPIKMPVKSGNQGGLIGGIILISLGLIFLANKFIPNVDFGDLWPLLLVVLGGVLIVTSFAERKSDKGE